MNRRTKRLQHLITGPVGLILLGVVILAVLLFLMSTAAEGSVRALPKIRERGVIYIGVRSDLPPFGNEDSSGELQGLEVDLANLIGEQILGHEGVIIVPVTNRTRRAKLDYGDVDMLISMVPDSAANRSLFKMSDVYYRDPIRLAVLSGATVDLSNGDAQFNIGVVSGSVAHNTFESYRKKAKINYINIAGYEDAKARLRSGELDGIVAETSFLTRILDDTVSLTEDNIGSVPYSICSRKTEPDLANEINRIYRAAKKDGTLAPIYEKYGLGVPQ